MKANPYRAYENNAVTTASPAELTLMLYNGCLKFIKQGKAAIENNDIQSKNTNLQKAQNIISELMITLNRDVSLSQNLESLYEYIHNRLIQANLNSDIEILNEVEGFVTDFRDTWKQVIQITRQENHKQAVGRV